MTMNLPGDDFDPDDNFGHAGDGIEIDESAAGEALAWQFLLLVNPGDEDAAAQQFADLQEALAASGGDEAELPELLREVTDWKSGFHQPAGDARGVVEALTELAARWNLIIDWGVEDPTDGEFLDGADVDDLLSTAHDRLREHGYALWLWDPGDGAHAGWVATNRDDEAMRVLAPALGIDIRPGGD